MITVSVAEDPLAMIVYHLKQDLSLASVEVADHFIPLHKRMRLEGRLDHDFAETDVDAFRKIRCLTTPSWLSGQKIPR